MKRVYVIIPLVAAALANALPTSDDTHEDAYFSPSHSFRKSSFLGSITGKLNFAINRNPWG